MYPDFNDSLRVMISFLVQEIKIVIHGVRVTTIIIIGSVYRALTMSRSRTKYCTQISACAQTYSTQV